MTSMRPYLLRAIHQWIVDNGLTPYLLVDATQPKVEVPGQYIENGKIILNTSPTAVQGLTLDNDWVSFSARFSGRAFSIFIPVSAILAVYAKENGKGMFFKPEENTDETPPPTSAPPPPRSKPVLKRVK
ncbi:MAG: ClpXP protease specificity-enhancing factor [Thioploca sp.]|nr:ClpXP protease specificity-enhancing factor [Thioploca sp.]